MSRGRGSCATLTGLTGRINKEKKIKIYYMAKHDEGIGQNDEHQVAKISNAPEHKSLLADSKYSTER